MTEKEISPKKKKKFFTNLNKNQKIGLGATSIMALAAIISGIYFYYELQEETEFVFKCGLDDAPDSIDPLKNPGPKYVNLIILDQIAEGLFAYDQNKTDTPIVPNLALNGTWSADHINFTCTLRQNVTFHDGTPFNASAVKWNFDRIYNFIETMPYDQIWAWEYAYLISDRKPIINRTEIIDNYTIKFVLNQPYVPIRELLALWNSYILSPTSTPEDEFIDIRNGRLVGTGPFIFDQCEVIGVIVWKHICMLIQIIGVECHQLINWLFFIWDLQKGWKEYSLETFHTLCGIVIMKHWIFLEQLPELQYFLKIFLVIGILE